MSTFNDKISTKVADVMKDSGVLGVQLRCHLTEFGSMLLESAILKAVEQVAWILCTRAAYQINDSVLRREIRKVVEDGLLQSSDTREIFVVCDDSNNPCEDIDHNRLRVSVCIRYVFAEVIFEMVIGSGDCDGWGFHEGRSDL